LLSGSLTLCSSFYDQIEQVNPENAGELELPR